MRLWEEPKKATEDLFSHCCVESKTISPGRGWKEPKVNWMRGSENGVIELPAPCSQSQLGNERMRGPVSGRTCQKGTRPGSTCSHQTHRARCSCLTGAHSKSAKRLRHDAMARARGTVAFSPSCTSKTASLRVLSCPASAQRLPSVSPSCPGCPGCPARRRMANKLPKLPGELLVLHGEREHALPRDREAQLTSAEPSVATTWQKHRDLGPGRRL
jgi:hypothetical protein